MQTLITQPSRPTTTRAAWRTPPSSSQTASWSQSDSEPPPTTPTASSRPTSSRRRHSQHGSARAIAAKFSGEVGLAGTDSSTQRMGARSQTFAKTIPGGASTGLEAIRTPNGSKLKPKVSNPVLKQSTDPFSKGIHGSFQRSDIGRTSSGAIVGPRNASSSDTIRSSLTSSTSVRSTWSERTVSSSTERQPASLPRVGRAVAVESPGPLPEPQTLFGSHSNSMKR